VLMNVVAYLSSLLKKQVWKSVFNFLFFASVDSLRHHSIFCSIPSQYAGVHCLVGLYLTSFHRRLVYCFFFFLVFMGYGVETARAERDVFFLFSVTWITAHVHTMS
jgi:hypothetical protein